MPARLKLHTCKCNINIDNAIQNNLWKAIRQVDHYQQFLVQGHAKITMHFSFWMVIAMTIQENSNMKHGGLCEQVGRPLNIAVVTKTEK